MRSHAKAPFAGSICGAGNGRARLPIAGLCLAVALAFAGIGASSAFGASMGVTGYFGNPGTAGSTVGGQFGTITSGGQAFTTPKGVAVRNSTGDIYAVDTSNNRIQRFSSSGAFISAWGADVILGGASGTGTVNPGSATVEAVTTTSKAFIAGDAIQGTGIPAGTTIIAVAATTLTLSQSATGAATGAGTALTSPAGPANTPVNEVQTVTVGASVTAGTFKLKFTAPNPQSVTNPQSTAAIPFNASAAEVQAALEALTNVGGGNVAVTSSNPGGGAEPGGPYAIEFKGARYADTNVEFLVTENSLTGGTATAANSVEGGVAYEICVVAAECKAGAPTPTTLAPGGSLNSPQGVAVNQSSGDVYVTASLNRIEQFSAAGSFIRAWGVDVVQAGKPGDNPVANAVQTLTVTASGGKYSLGFQDQQTPELAFNSTAAQIQAALQALTSIGTGNATVAESSPGVYTITFTGALANNPEPLIQAISGPAETLSGGTASVANTTPGSNGFEICNNAADCKRGAGGGTALSNSLGYPAVVPVGAANAGAVLVPDFTFKRVSEFSANGDFVRLFGFDVAQPAASPASSASFEVCRASVFDACKAAVNSSPAGALGSFANNQPTRVAADTTGAIYTVESTGSFRVQKFTPSGGGGLTPSLFNPSIGVGETLTSSSPAPSAANTPTNVAVDPTDNHLYVVRTIESGKGAPAANSAERRIFEFDAAGTLVETHLANYALSSVNGFALKAGGEPGYLTSGTPKGGVHTIAEPVPPTVAVNATTAIGAHSATLHGTVNPNGGGTQQTSYRFEYSSDGGANWIKVTPTDTNVGSGESPVAVSQALTGLEANKDYVARIVATKGGLPTTSSPGGAFKTATAAPAAETLNAWWDGTTGELILKAKVNPNNQPSTYFFEYGPEDCSANPCTSAPLSEDAAAGAGGKDIIVTQAIPGLDTESSYHYRVIASNAAGTTSGTDRTIGPGPAIESCSNQALRVENDSESLPECRAYELVSNADSNGLGIIEIKAISDDGERAMLLAQVLGVPSSLAGQNTLYVAEPGAAGWEIVQHNPDPATGSSSTALGNTPYSSDLSTLLWGQSTSKEFIAGEVQWLFTRSDGSEEPAIPHLAPLEQVGGTGGIFEFRGASLDLSTFLFQKAQPRPDAVTTYLPGEPLVVGENSVSSINLYQATDAGPSGSLSLVNRDPSGTPISNVCGSSIGGRGSSFNQDPAGLNARPVSRDGSVVYFNARPGAATSGNCDRSTFGLRIFKRVNDSSTVEVSKSQCTRTLPTPCSANNGDDVFQGASADGESVFFTTMRQLTDSDEDFTQDLYLYDSSPPAGQPTLVQASAGEVTSGHPKVGSGAEVQGVVESATDGSRVYFVAKGQLTSDATAGANNLYVFQRDDTHPSGTTSFIATLPNGDSIGDSSGLWSNGYTGKEVRVMPFYGPGGSGGGNGHLLLFTSSAKLLSDDTDSAKDLYRYDAEAEDMLCLSCQGDGESDVLIGTAFSDQPTSIQSSRTATEDASAVVFTTKEALLGGDQNTTADVYLWREGILSLISGGAGQAGVGAGLAGGVDSFISPDGKRILFTTKAALFPTDQNSGLDAYSATIGGGFPHPVIPVSKCEDGQACRGPAPLPPPTSPPASEGFSGAGNATPPKACKKGKVKRKGRCVKRKQRKNRNQSAKRTNNKRGGNR